MLDALDATLPVPERDPRTDPRIGDGIRYPVTCRSGDARLTTFPQHVVEGFWERWGERGVLVGGATGRTDLDMESGIERWTLEQWTEREGATYTTGPPSTAVDHTYKLGRIAVGAPGMRLTLAEVEALSTSSFEGPLYAEDLGHTWAIRRRAEQGRALSFTPYKDRAELFAAAPTMRLDLLDLHTRVSELTQRLEAEITHFHALQDRHAALLIKVDKVLDAWTPDYLGPGGGEVRRQRGVGSFALVNQEGWWTFDRHGYTIASGSETGAFGKHLADTSLVSIGCELIGGVHPMWAP